MVSLFRVVSRTISYQCLPLKAQVSGLTGPAEVGWAWERRLLAISIRAQPACLQTKGSNQADTLAFFQDRLAFPGTLVFPRFRGRRVGRGPGGRDLVFSLSTRFYSLLRIW